MNDEQLIAKLNELRSLPEETECFEFKRAEKDFDFNRLGKYFSNLGNEANLKGKTESWLIFGIDNKTRKPVGSNYRAHGKHTLESLKKEIADKATSRITFVEVYELPVDGKRIVMFQIPAAPHGIPVAWEGHYYGREGESLAALSPQEYETIRNQTKPDWSAQIVERATIDDLDPKAILKAREEFKIKSPKMSSETDAWDDFTFLNKAKIPIEGKLTRTAILLLGRNESDDYISPAVARISWILRDERDSNKDYEHFGTPFLLSTDFALAKIRNLKVRYLPDNTLFPVELTQYEPYVMREALHNCIAHQNYELRSKIAIAEKPEELIFSNAGSFLPGTVESVIRKNAPPRYYRNLFLSTAMANLNMIDTIGGGIRKMFDLQRKRFFPLPTYLLGEGDVTVKITGKVIDENYTRLLTKQSGLDIHTVILLDKVQKREKLDKESYGPLKKQGLVEGRYPNLFVVSEIASLTGDKATYIRNRGFDSKHYKEMILSFLEEFGSASRKDINSLLFNNLPEILTNDQKINRIRNLLYEMAKKDKLIKNSGSNKSPKWELVESKIRNK